jgi:hypothetical protein
MCRGRRPTSLHHVEETLLRRQRTHPMVAPSHMSRDGVKDLWARRIHSFLVDCHWFRLSPYPLVLSSSPIDGEKDRNSRVKESRAVDFGWGGGGKSNINNLKVRGSAIRDFRALGRNCEDQGFSAPCIRLFLAPDLLTILLLLTHLVQLINLIDESRAQAVI